MNKVVLATIDGKTKVTGPTKLFDPNNNFLFFIFIFIQDRISILI